ncbi:metallopeptidase TldD-related protein [Frateuria aurantia]
MSDAMIDAGRWLADRGLSIDDALVNLTRAMGRWAARADFYAQWRQQEVWSLESGVVRSGSYLADTGFALRTVRDGEYIFASGQALTGEAMRQAAAQVASAAGDGAYGVISPSPTVDTAVKPRYGHLDPLPMLDGAAKRAILQQVDQAARSLDPRVVRVSAQLAGEYGSMCIVHADGRSSVDARPLVMLSVHVQVESGGRRESASQSLSWRAGYEQLTERVVAALVAEVVRVALVNLEARPAPAGQMSVVMGPGSTGILLHEAVGHGLEGDFIRRGSSAFAGRLGERVAAPGVSVVDDGTLWQQRGSLTVDDEGQPSQRNVLIDDGILVGYLQDQLNGTQMGGTSTGNARRQHYGAPPMPRMTNTFMQAGTEDPQDIIRSVPRGLYIAGLGSGQVDITSGRFVFQTSEAYLIEDGHITAPVTGATILGEGPHTLQRVSRIGSDLQISDGAFVCSKNGQDVPVSVGQPTLRLDAVTVGGTAT